MEGGLDLGVNRADSWRRSGRARRSGGGEDDGDRKEYSTKVERSWSISPLNFISLAEIELRMFLQCKSKVRHSWPSLDHAINNVQLLIERSSFCPCSITVEPTYI